MYACHGSSQEKIVTSSTISSPTSLFQDGLQHRILLPHARQLRFGIPLGHFQQRTLPLNVGYVRLETIHEGFSPGRPHPRPFPLPQHVILILQLHHASPKRLNMAGEDNIAVSHLGGKRQHVVRVGGSS